MTHLPANTPIIRYKKISDYRYKLPKVSYIKRDLDIYREYVKDKPNPLTLELFIKIIEECFKLAITRALDYEAVKIPYVGEIYIKYIKRKDGKPLIDRRRLYHEGIVKVLHHLKEYPKLKLGISNKRYRNCNMYSAYGAKPMRSFLFKKYIDS